MSKENYSKLNDLVMGVVYSPFLIVIAFLESRAARKVRANRAKGEEDDDETEEWEELQGEVDILGEGWEQKVLASVPDLDTDPVVAEVLKLKSEIDELKALLKGKKAEPEEMSSASSSDD